MHAPVTRKDSEIAVTIWDGRELREDRVADARQRRAALSQRALPGARAPRRRAATTALVLRYDVVDKPWTVSGYIHRDKEQDAYFALGARGARDCRASATLAKDVTLVIDRSGSMMGEPIRQARAACVDIVSGCAPTIASTSSLFDHTVEKLYPEPRPVTEAIRKQAIEYVEMMDEGGGTDLAIGAGAGAGRAGAARRSPARRAVLHRRAVGCAARCSRRRRPTSATCACSPSASARQVNRPLLARLAARKRGRFTYIAAAADIETRGRRSLYRQIDAPVLVDVSLETSGGAASRLYPPTLPDLFVDDELRVTGRLRASGPVTFTIKGKQGGRPFAHSVKFDGAAGDQAALGRAAVGARRASRTWSRRSRWRARGRRWRTR